MVAERMGQTHRTEQANGRSSIEVGVAGRRGSPAINHPGQTRFGVAYFRSEVLKIVRLRWVDSVSVIVDAVEVTALLHDDRLSPERPEPLGDPCAKTRLLVEDKNAAAFVQRALITFRRGGLAPDRAIKPTRRIARLVARRCCVRPRTDPVTLTFARIGGQADASTAFRFMEAIPIDVDSVCPKLAQRGKNHFGL